MSNPRSIRPLRPGRWALSMAAGLVLSGCQGVLPSATFQPNAATPVSTAATIAETAVPGGVVLSGRVISTGGGNWIGTNTGTVISTGGGNVISTGGGNFRVLQSASTVVVKLKLSTGRELTTEADAEGRFRFEIVPAAGETLATSGELTLQSNTQQIVVSYPTGGDANTSWIHFQAGVVFDLGNVTVDGTTTRVEKNPLTLVDSDRDGQFDAVDLDDDGDGKSDAADHGSSVYDSENRPAAAEHGLTTSTEAKAKDPSNSESAPVDKIKNPVKDTVKETGKGGKKVIDGVSDTVAETGDGNDSDAQDESPVETVVDTVETVTEKLPKLGL